MALNKNPKCDLRRASQRIFEVSLIIALILTIAAFKYFPEIEAGVGLEKEYQETIKMIDIAHTIQKPKPPPPPKPPVLVEALVNEDIDDDIEIPMTDVNEADKVDAPPPMLEEDDEPDEPYIFVPVEEPPAPVGGIGTILSFIEYPEMAKRAGVQGKVFVHAYVDTDGTVTKVELIKGIGAGCDEEALNAVKKTKFSPGRQRGKAVKVRIAVPVIFKLQ